jgi:hypothetical protein
LPGEDENRVSGGLRPTHPIKPDGWGTRKTQIPFGNDKKKSECKNNAGVSPLRIAKKPQCFGRDDEFYTG